MIVKLGHKRKLNAGFIHTGQAELTQVIFWARCINLRSSHASMNVAKAVTE